MARTAGRAITTEVIRVTPAQAKQWLENNHVNRNQRPKVVAAYRRDMEQGRWQFTGEAIKISRTGYLIDGQHRLMALAEAEDVRGIDMLVVTGLPDDVQSLIDQGVPRSIRDALTLEHGHIRNVTVVAGVSRWMVLAPEVGPTTNPSVLRNKVTAAEALEAFNAESDLIIEAGYWGQKMRSRFVGSPTAVGYTFVQLAKVDKSAAEEFFEGMHAMNWSLQFGLHDPRKAALTRLQMMHADENVKTSIETGVVSVSVFTRAWNAWRKGEQMETIGVRTKTGIILPVTPV